MTARKLITHIERPAIDLRRRHFERRKHGMIIIGTWLRDGNRQQPCLVLLHGARPVARGRTIPVIIPLESAWRWAAHGDVGDPAHCSEMALEWMGDGLLPGNGTRGAVCILDAINESLPDLIAMPPAPRGEVQTLGDLIITNRQTGEVTEREMKQDV